MRLRIGDRCELERCLRQSHLFKLLWDNGSLSLRIYLSVLQGNPLAIKPGGTTLTLIILIILLLLVFGTFPAYPYSRGWGYYPSGGLGTILLIVLILWLLHVI